MNLEKDTEVDETILQNTYHPEEGSPRYTKNQRREKEIADKVNINNSRNQEETQTSKAKRKSKRELPSLPVSDTSYIEKDSHAANSEAALEADDVGRGKESKRKIKKGKSKGDESQVEDAEDKLLAEYQQQIAQAEVRSPKKTRVKAEEESVVSQSVVLNNDVGKKKKKKLKSVVTESDYWYVYF